MSLQRLRARTEALRRRALLLSLLSLSVGLAASAAERSDAAVAPALLVLALAGLAWTLTSVRQAGVARAREERAQRRTARHR